MLMRRVAADKGMFAKPLSTKARKDDEPYRTAHATRFVPSVRPNRQDVNIV